MPLQRTRFDSGFAEFLCRAGCRREAFHPVTFSPNSFADRCQRSGLASAGDTFQRSDLIPACEDLLDRCALTLAQMGMVFLDFPAGMETGKRRVLVLSLAHG